VEIVNVSYLAGLVHA